MRRVCASVKARMHVQTFLPNQLIPIGLSFLKTYKITHWGRGGEWSEGENFENMKYYCVIIFY